MLNSFPKYIDAEGHTLRMEFDRTAEHFAPILHYKHRFRFIEQGTLKYRVFTAHCDFCGLLFHKGSPHLV